MADNPLRLRVFVASPSDTEGQGAALGSVVDELDKGVAKSQGITLELVRWRSHGRPGVGKSGPQDLVNDVIPPCDIVIGILWKRLGTPTSVEKSGTAEEIMGALDRRDRGEHVEVLVYFNKAEYALSRRTETKQVKRLLKFQSRLYGRNVVSWDYNGVEDLESKVRQHLTDIILEWRMKGGLPSYSASGAGPSAWHDGERAGQIVSNSPSQITAAPQEDDLPPWKEDDPAPATGPSRPRPVKVTWKKFLLWIAAPVVVLVIGVVVVLFIPRSRAPHAPVCGRPRVVIEKLSNASHVPAKVTVHGTAKCLPAKQELWLIVWDGRWYYPQARLHVRPRGTTGWERPVTFGNSDETGQKFTLYAVGASAAASRQFDTYLGQPLSKANDSYPKVAIYQRVRVVRAVPPPLTIRITSPKSTVNCRGYVGACEFTVSGTSTSVASNMRILVLVCEVAPSGGCWWIQWPPVTPYSPNGDWSQEAFVGGPGYPMPSGSIFKLEAIVVRTNAIARLKRLYESQVVSIR